MSKLENLVVAETGPAKRFVVRTAEGVDLAMTYGQPDQADHAHLFASAPKFKDALQQVAECLVKHARYAHVGNGYLEEAEAIIDAALVP